MARKGGVGMAEGSTLAGDRAMVAAAPDGVYLRRVLGLVPTSVCVVTTMADGAPAGSVVGTFTSVSLDPPLIAFFSQHGSDMLAAVLAARTFAVNVLAADQADACHIFSRRNAERFRSDNWHRGPRGNPHLPGSLVALECVLESATEVGDHVMVLGRVVELETQRTHAHPLVFWSAGLHGLANHTSTPKEQ